MKNLTKPVTLTGRIKTGPDDLLHEEILKPQFDYESEYYLPWYILIEKALLVEYKRMGLIEGKVTYEINNILNEITKENLIGDPKLNMTDISFAIEQYVEQRVKGDAYAWHVDKSRNDFQACAQIMFGREQIFETIHLLQCFADTVYNLANKTTMIPMPGYTHYQAAQIISPGFYLSSIYEQIIKSMYGLLNIFDRLNKCPLGAGAMAGQELDWDRNNMAYVLGFDEAQRHALVSVASREWTLLVAGELSNLSMVLSRFVTDLIQWGSSEYGFIDLPDQLSGISSIMPQKKNFPVFERIRARTAHVSAFYIDFIMGQRNTSFTNLVEVSKEAGTNVINMFKTIQSVLKLFTAVIDNLKFNEERMQIVCKSKYFGGSSLANLLTLHGKIPYRKAQVISGKYIKTLLDRNFTSQQVDVELLSDICKDYGFKIDLTYDMVSAAFNYINNLHDKTTRGATSNQSVIKMLKEQKLEYEKICFDWKERGLKIEEANKKLESLLLA